MCHKLQMDLLWLNQLLFNKGNHIKFCLFKLQFRSIQLFASFQTGSPKVNLTGIVDVLNGLVQKLESTTDELEETRRKLEQLEQKTLGWIFRFNVSRIDFSKFVKVDNKNILSPIFYVSKDESGIHRFSNRYKFFTIFTQGRAKKKLSKIAPSGVWNQDLQIFMPMPYQLS